MFRPAQPVAERKGVILLVVLCMLMLFAVVGVSFVIYANAEATTSGVLKSTPSLNTIEVDPELALSLALGQIVYDVPDDGNGVWSSFRGHSFSRNAFGYNDAANGLNDTPYSGPGRLNVPSIFPNSSIANAKNDAFLVNYMFFASAGDPLRDPEHPLAARPSPGAGQTPYQYSQYANNLANRSAYIAANPSYTYPDQNSLFLAASAGERHAVDTVLSPRMAFWPAGRSDEPELDQPGGTLPDVSPSPR